MKKLSVVALATVLLVVMGCSTSPATPETEESPETSPDVTAAGETVEDNAEIAVSEEPLDVDSGFALYGSRVEFDGVYPGWSGTVPVTIVNGEDAEKSFRLSVMTPSKLDPGWEALPEEYHDWITISEPTVTLSAGQIYEVPVTLTMPPDADYSGKKAEVRILVENTDQQGFVQIALAARWLIRTSE